MSNLHTLQSKLQNVVINESNSNHIIENSSHIIKKSINIENCENNKLNEYEKDIENGHVHVDTREQQLTDFSEIISQNYYHHPTEIQLNDTKSLEDLEIVEMTRELPNETTEIVKITYKVYESELELPSIMKLIQKDLSEPYSIYTYRYFIHNWPKLCYLAIYENKCIGCIVCKLDIHRQMIKRGYIAMLAVDKDYRKLKIGTTLVQKAIRMMIANQADEVVLETEITNQPALRLYENLGFVRDKRLFHYYLNGVDALRLKCFVKSHQK